jgi:hypothetical protein
MIVSWAPMQPDATPLDVGAVDGVLDPADADEPLVAVAVAVAVTVAGVEAMVGGRAGVTDGTGLDELAIGVDPLLVSANAVSASSAIAARATANSTRRRQYTPAGRGPRGLNIANHRIRGACAYGGHRARRP